MDTDKFIIQEFDNSPLDLLHFNAKKLRDCLQTLLDDWLDFSQEIETEITEDESSLTMIIKAKEGKDFENFKDKITNVLNDHPLLYVKDPTDNRSRFILYSDQILGKMYVLALFGNSEQKADKLVAVVFDDITEMNTMIKNCSCFPHVVFGDSLIDRESVS